MVLKPGHSFDLSTCVIIHLDWFEQAQSDQILLKRVIKNGTIDSSTGDLPTAY
jgi:hypothetical protein